MIAEVDNSPAFDPTPTIDVWALLRRRGQWLIAGTIIGLLLAGFYAITAEKVYQSESEMLVIDKDATLGTNKVDVRFGEDVLATHHQIMSSRRIIEDAVTTDSLLQLEGLQKAIVDHEEDSDLAAAVTYIIDHLDVKQGGEGRAKGALVLRPTFSHSDADEAGRVLLSVVNSYQRFLNDSVYGADNEAATLISRANDDIELEVAAREAAYREFREQAPILWKPDGTSVNPHEVGLIDIETSLSQLRLRKTEVQSRLEIIEARLDSAEDDVDANLQRLAIIDNADIGRLTLLLQAETGNPMSEQFQAAQPVRVETASAEFDRLLALELEVEKQKLGLGPRHPSVVELENQIGQLRTFLKNRDALPALDVDQAVTIERLAKVYTRLLKYDLADFERREKALLKLADEERDRAKELVRIELQEESLRSASERAKALHHSVLDRLSEINLLKDQPGFISQVIDPVRAGQLTWPNIPLIVGLGAVVGCFLGCGLALWVELNDRSFRSPADVYNQLQLPILAQIPSIAAARKRVVEGYDRRMCVVHQPASAAAEALQTLRAAIGSLLPQHSVIHISSPHRGGGNSTVVSNLAVAFANTGQRVLLIDANFRHPSVHEFFASTNEVGLSSVLHGEACRDEATQQSLIENLDIITSGPSVANPSEVVASPLLEKLFADVKQDYEFVLVDGPPILPFSDSISIASHADFFLLHISAKTDSRDLAVSSLSRLAAVSRATVIGTIVNQSKWSDEKSAGLRPALGSDVRQLPTQTHQLGNTFLPRNGTHRLPEEQST